MGIEQIEHAIIVNSFEFFTPILDADVPGEYRATLAKYRQLANEHGVPTTAPVCYRVRAGFTLKSHAPMAGPCRRGFDYLQSGNFPDEPTIDCIVFWVPCILNASTSKTKDQQRTFLADLGRKLGLPVHHLSGFGKVALVAGLILAHLKAACERIPFPECVRTDTCYADDYRLGLGYFGAAGLDCVDEVFDGTASARLGVFALGVEPFGI